ncbi:MAG TPA: TonB-dependent receptor, partial [Opitutaceae bacterium]
ENEILQDQKRWNEEIHIRTGPLGALLGELGVWLSRGTTDNFVDRSIPGLFPIEVSGFEEGDSSAALFGEISYALAPGIAATVGLRGESDGKEFTRHEEAPTPGLVYAGSARYDALLPRLAVDWTAPDGSHADASVAFGLRPGGFSSFTDNPLLIPFASERTTAYSVGWDRALAGRSLRLAVRAFYDAISNLQIERSFTAADYFVATAPRGHSVGAEVEGTWHPSPEWTVGAAAGLSCVRLDSFTAPINGRDESGNEAPGAPLYNAGLEATYRPARGWFASGQLTLVGATRYDELGTGRYTQGAYSLAALRAGYETPRWSFTLYGDNLGNTAYYALIVPGVNSGAPGAPRTVGARAALKF